MERQGFDAKKVRSPWYPLSLSLSLSHTHTDTRDWRSVGAELFVSGQVARDGQPGGVGGEDHHGKQTSVDRCAAAGLLGQAVGPPCGAPLRCWVVSTALPCRSPAMFS
jgi:hypothetical protein